MHLTAIPTSGNAMALSSSMIMVLHRKLRKRYSHIKLILVLPCTTQTKGWSKDDIAVYEEIKSQADKVVYTSHDYFRGCMFKRNRHLVNGSSVCIAYLTQEKGGTAYTVNYARQNNVQVINLAAQYFKELYSQKRTFCFQLPISVPKRPLIEPS